MFFNRTTTRMWNLLFGGDNLKSKLQNGGLNLSLFLTFGLKCGKSGAGPQAARRATCACAECDSKHISDGVRETKG